MERRVCVWFAFIIYLIVGIGMAGDQQKILALNDTDKIRLVEQRSGVEKYLGDPDSREKHRKPEVKLGILRALLAARGKSTMGRDPAILCKQTSVMLYPLTMISKRIERGDTVDVFALYNGIAARAEKLIKEGY